MEEAAKGDPFENRPLDRKLHDSIFTDLRQVCPSARTWKVDIEPITRGQLYVPDKRNRAAAEVEQLGDIEGTLVVKYRIRWVYQFDDGPYILDGRGLWIFEASYPTIISMFTMACHIDCIVFSYEMVSEHARGVVAVYAKDEPAASSTARPRAKPRNAWAKAKRLLDDALSTTFRGLTAEQMERLQQPDWDTAGDPPTRGESRRRDGSSTLDEPESDEVDALEAETARAQKVAKVDIE